MKVWGFKIFARRKELDKCGDMDTTWFIVGGLRTEDEAWPQCGHEEKTGQEEVKCLK